MTPPRSAADEELLHHRGLALDLAQLEKMRGRRQVLRMLGGLGLVPLVVACGVDATGNDGGTSSGVTTGTGSVTSCSTIPEETEGPFPADGSNGPNALSLSGIVRSDIRSSFAGASGTAEGIPITINLTLVSTKSSCAPLAGYAVYLWHCDRNGEYSLYGNGVTDQNYLRGVQTADANGLVTFTSIFPACYSGRWPHIHFEIYPSASGATSAGSKIATSQMAMLQSVCNDVYATSGYSASASNLARVSLSSDMVFSDGTSLQLPTVTGNVTEGYVVSLTVGVAA